MVDSYADTWSPTVATLKSTTEAAALDVQPCTPKALQAWLAKAQVAGTLRGADGLVPVGSSYHLFFGYLSFCFDSPYHQVGYAKEGIWYEPTGSPP